MSVSETSRAGWLVADDGGEPRHTPADPFVGIARIDRAGHIQRVNARLCAMLGYSEQELLGKALREVTGRDDQAADAAGFAHLGAGEIRRYRSQKRLVRCDGSTLWVDAQIESLDGGGSVPYVMTVLDIADRKDLEDALQRRNRRLVQFASLLGHDLRSVLNVMALHAQLAKAALGEEAPRARSSLDTIVNTARGAAGFMTQLQEYAASVTHHADLDRVSLQHVVAQTLATLEPQGARVEVGDLPRVLSKEAILARVLLSVFQNALERCSPADPRLEIGAVCSARHPGLVGLVARTNGPGVDREEQEHMFSALFRSEVSSAEMALGLAFCREHIEDIGGSIWIESAPGNGIQIALVLPGG
jgi:PAS domain S-box-containing protein